MTNILSILAGILLLGILVAVHEFGHFISARLCGIEVNEFALGFGPKLLGWQSKKSGTQFSVRAIPLGGYCAFYGEDDAEGKTADDPRAYARQPVWKRMISVLMGPGMNFILAFVVLTLFLWVRGVLVYEPFITAVTEGGPAWEAGIRAGDVVESVEGTWVMDGTVDTLIGAISAYDGEGGLAMHVRRDDGMFDTVVTPVFSEEDGRYLTGVMIGLQVRRESAPDGTMRKVREPITLAEALRGSWDNCVYAGGLILNAFKDLITRGEGLDQTSGPVGVVTLVSEQVREGGFEQFINLLIIISINLGVMNLLPIPGLDGSRFLFMVLEAIRRKPVPPQKEAVVHLAGMALLFGAMILLTFRDVLRLFH